MADPWIAIVIAAAADSPPPRCTSICVSNGTTLEDPGGLRSRRALRFLAERDPTRHGYAVFDLETMLEPLLADAGAATRAALIDHRTTAWWHDFELDWDGLTFTVRGTSGARAQLHDASKLFEQTLEHAVVTWGVRAGCPHNPEGAASAAAALLERATSDGWLTGGIRATVARRDRMRSPRPPVEQRVPPEECFATGKPWFPCLNCDSPVWRDWWLYCSLRCRAVAKAVRYARGVSADRARADDPLVQDAIRTKIAFAVAGGYDEAARRLTPSQREAVFARDGRRCRRCGNPATEIDHIGTATSAEDLNHPDNLQSLCWACHREKTQTSMRPATSQEQLEIEAILARIHQSDAARVCDEPGYDQHTIRAQRSAIAAAVRKGDRVAAHAACEFDHRLSCDWRAIPGVGRRTADILATLGVANLGDLSTSDIEALAARASTAGLDPTVDREWLEGIVNAAAQVPACFR